VHFVVPSSNLSTFGNGFLFTSFASSIVSTFNTWMQMHHSIVDSTNLEEQRSKSNLVKSRGGMQRAFNDASNSKCLCSLNITGKWGTPFLWCKYLWCVHKCYFQICVPFSIFSSCMCLTILCFLHFKHLGSQRGVSMFVSQSCESIWGHCFRTKNFCKFVDCVRFVSKATL
jgi:hypothetical protein